MAISPLGFGPQQKMQVTFGKSTPPGGVKNKLGITPETADKLDFYGKTAGAGGIGAFTANLLTRKGKSIKAGFIGMVAAPIAAFGLDKGVKYVSEQVANSGAKALE